MTRRIPVQSPIEQAAFNQKQAALYLGVSTKTIWRLKNLPQSHPCHLKTTAWGTYPKAELDRVQAAALNRTRI